MDLKEARLGTEEKVRKPYNKGKTGKGQNTAHSAVSHTRTQPARWRCKRFKGHLSKYLPPLPLPSHSLFTLNVGHICVHLAWFAHSTCLTQQSPSSNDPDWTFSHSGQFAMVIWSQPIMFLGKSWTSLRCLHNGAHYSLIGTRVWRKRVSWWEGMFYFFPPFQLTIVVSGCSDFHWWERFITYFLEKAIFSQVWTFRQDHPKKVTNFVLLQLRGKEKFKSARFPPSPQEWAVVCSPKPQGRAGPQAPPLQGEDRITSCNKVFVTTD